MNGIDFLADTNFLIHVHEGNEIVSPFLDYHFAISYITEIELLGKFSLARNEKLKLGYPLLVQIMDLLQSKS